MSLKLAHKFSVLMILGGLIASICNAQTTDKPVERPTLTKGDTWTYRVIDNWTEKEIRQNQTDFVENEGNNFVFRVINKTTESTSTIRTTLDLNACRVMQNSNDIICQGPYKFPATLGQKTSFSKLPYANGKGFFQAECTLAAMEKVTVLAGVFDAHRIDCTGFWTNVFDSTASGRYKEIIWYAPKAKRYVKSYYETVFQSGQLDTKLTNELIAYKIQ